MPSVGGWLDAKEVAKRLQISVSAVHGLRSRGTLPSEWLSGRRVWSVEVVNRYLGDVGAQKRRRAAHVLTVGGREMLLDQAVRHAQSMRAQAPLEKLQQEPGDGQL